MTPDEFTAALQSGRVDYATLTGGELLAYAVGRAHGARAALACRDAEDSEAAHAEAARIVVGHSKMPARDHEADRARAAARESWWAERRGEEVAA